MMKTLFNPSLSPHFPNLFIQKLKTKSQAVINKLLVIFVFALPISLHAQTSTNEAEWNGYGYSLKKVVSNNSIASGVNFSYTILFTAPAGATTVTIQDAIPSSLVVVNVPTPSIVNGVTPTVAITGSVGSQVVTYSLTSLPAGSPSSGSFTIVVKFPEGTTCNGATARNRVGMMVNGKYEYTPYVSTTATAVNPWKISKSIVSGPVVNPNGGSCGYLMNPGTTVTYRVSIMKDNGYWGNVIGQENMTSAQVTDVLPTGAVFVSSTCGATLQSGNTYSWTVNSGTLDAANPWAYYYCDITVTYPAGSFPNGSFVYNQATLSGTVCNQPVTMASNQTCIEVGTVTPVTTAYFQKYVNVTNRVPGCNGYYTLAFCNTGNTTMSAFNINDVIPSGVTVTSVQLYGANSSTMINLTANSGANTIGTNIAAYFTSGAINYTVNDIALQMTGTLPAGQCIYLYIYFTINSNPTGTVVTNCATFNGLSNGLTLPQTCANFTVDAGAPVPCLLKDICSPQTDYEPGDIIRFRIRVQNIGSANLTGASIQDMLNPNFSYVGNETYYVSSSYNPACTNGSGVPAGATAWTGVAPSHSGNNLSWNLPTIPSDCQSFYVGYCGYYGTWSLPYYYIEFDVQVDGSALPGVTPNNYTISGGNLSTPVQSNTVNALVVASFGQEVEKQVSVDNGSTFASSGTIAPGANAKYRLKYKNTSNVPVSSIQLVDLLARNDGTNDWLVLNRTVSRGSQFDITYANSPATSLMPVSSPPTPSISFAPGQNICLPAFGLNSGCTNTTWSSTTDKNVLFSYGTYSLLTNVSLMQDFDVAIPSTATVQQTVCNDFAAISTANFLLNGNAQSVALTPIPAPPVCLTVTDNVTSCCESVTLQSHQDAAGAGCCAELRTTCEVKAIEVNVTNGTISSASWNCGTIPAGYVGASSYTFAANNCAVDLVACFEATQSGVVTVTYTIYFANGEKCEKTIELDCKASSSCCDAVKLEQVVNSDGTVGCCAKLVTDCEVKAIEVNVTNGTISSASWNCGTIPAGYVGASSYTFAANNCAVDLVACFEATQSGVVTVTYTIYFANGEKCEKTIELDCKASSSCCDAVKLEQVVNSDGTVGCCAKLVTDCEVKAIEVNVTNGTISSASWNCGTIPAGYVGASSYTFAANNCAVDLVACFEATQSGVVTVTYTIYFANGEKCEKTIELDCKASSSCCDAVKLEQVVNSDGTVGCCAKLVTDCEVKAIEVNVTNGTISSASWNCGTIPAGYVGASSYTFAANNCAVDLIACFEATQSGVVTVTYTIYFANGEKCEKTIELDCKATSCCDGVKLERIPNSATDKGCCTELITECEVKSIDVSVSNGTISSASWNCGAIPAGYVGASTYTFVANGCAVDLKACFEATQTGIVTVAYTINFSNGESCTKKIELDCEATSSTSCCDSIKLERIAASATDKGCCTELITECEVKSIDVSVSNGTISSASWNCGAIPAGYVGASTYTFVANGCAVDLKACFEATQTGIVTITYVINFTNGETCKKTIELDCEATPDDCCALADFKLKQKWPFFGLQVGTFNITNIDPSSPICQVLINATPSATFTPGVLIVDGVTSSQSWNSTSIPLSGSLTNPAVNSIQFSMSAFNYHGVVQVCVIKCDGTKCCFDFKWNSKPIVDVDVSVDVLDLNGTLHAVSLTPKLNSSIDASIKYVAFGIGSEDDIAKTGAEFYAISGSKNEVEDYPASLSVPINSYMSKYNAFFELDKAVEPGKMLGAFNLVLTKQLPDLGCTLFDTDGNIVFSGVISISNSDTVSTLITPMPGNTESMELINVYPNPNSGQFSATFMTSKQRDVEIRLVNARGQILLKKGVKSYNPGIHKVNFEIPEIATGIYKLVIISDGVVLSKSFSKN